LRRCVADINARGVDAVIHSGDSVHHGAAEEYAYLREILSGLKVPLYFTPGNRDEKKGVRAALDGLARLPQGVFLHHAVDDHDFRLVALDSVTAGERKGTFCSERLAWLEETLSRQRKTPTVMFMHHPPFDIAPYYEGGYRRPQDTNELAAVVQRHPQVIRLICGHAHCMHTTEWAGIVATCMPSVAVDLRKGVDPAFGTTPLYALHSFSPDDSVATRLCAAGE
jgi:3',5'-cyclic AMP phosphodiesterase CpdA